MRRAILAAAVMAGAAEAARLPHQPLGFVHTTGRAAATTAGRSHPIQRSAMTTMTMTPGLDGAADGLSLTAASATSLYLAAGDLDNLEVIGYFAFLFTIVGSIFALGLRDNYKNDQLRTNRGDFISSIEMEIEALQTEGDDESLAVARDLAKKLAELQTDIEREKIEMLETRWFGLGKFLMPAGSESTKKAFGYTDSGNKDGSMGGYTPGAFGNSKSAEDYISTDGVNRNARRLQKKLKKKRVKKE